MDLSRKCALEPLNWAALVQLPARLEQRGLEIGIDATSVTIKRPPDAVTYDSLEEAASDVQQKGPPDDYSIFLRGTGPVGDWMIGIYQESQYIKILIDNTDDRAFIDSLMEFLGLKPLEISADEQPADPARTAFIAHRFDEVGEALADRLARFLQLMGFEVLTGRGYSPESVAEKVRARIESQALVFVIFTGGEEDTWLIQESVLGEVKGKTVFLIKEQGADFKSGLFGDREYISFSGTTIETAFIPILEGLRELSYEL